MEICSLKKSQETRNNKIAFMLVIIMFADAIFLKRKDWERRNNPIPPTISPEIKIKGLLFVAPTLRSTSPKVQTAAPAKM